MIDYINPKTGGKLREVAAHLVDAISGEKIALLRDGIPRFVSDSDDYAQSFGFQWNTWHDVQSERRGSRLRHAENLRKRSGLWDGAFDVEGKTLLECGMGGGDDTEVLLQLPLAELHSFDISNSVERAARYLSDPRLRISQASIYDIPYPPGSFDIVWCHRVLQHTPNPDQAMRCVCRMVKPGGFLFVHSYKRSFRYMQEFKYKYRWLTKRLPRTWVYNFVQKCGKPLHRLNHAMDRFRFTRWLAYNFVPLYKAPSGGIHRDMSDDENLEWEKLATFDALTPKHDKPMTTTHFAKILHEEGFEIAWLFDPPKSPLLARGIKMSHSKAA